MDTPPFSELGLPQSLLDSVEKLGYERPSPIQALTIPPLLAGKDVVGISQTGSGKTAAFGLPALAKIDFGLRAAQVLVVCPTRELAVQVCEEIHRLGSSMPELRAVPVYGGAAMDRQIRALRGGTQIVVGTPGRLQDHLRRKTFDPSQIKLVVLDEADRMLDMGFRDDMEELLAEMPEDRQTIYFSATMNKNVERLIEGFSKNPTRLEVEQKTKTVSTIDQSYYEVRNRSKIEVVSRLLDMYPQRLGIVFCNTKRAVDECVEALLARGYAADRLHGDLTQMMRDRVIKRFREGIIELLVATDVAARGLDIDDVDVVFNYDLPQDPEDYVHRIGRTGRVGRDGRAISFVFGREIYRMQAVERYTGQKIRREKIPTLEQVSGKRADVIFDAVRERLESGDYQTHQEHIDRLLEAGHTPTDIAGCFFSMLRETVSSEGEAIAEDSEAGRKGKRDDRPERPERRDRREPEGRRDRRVDERREKERGQRTDRNADGEPQDPKWYKGDRRTSKHRPDRGEAAMAPVPGSMARLFLSVGKQHGASPGDIAGMIYREAEIPNGAIGKIAIFHKHALVDVREDLAETVIQATRRSKLRGTPVKMGFDRGSREG